jgi:hypothetical protein
MVERKRLNVTSVEGGKEMPVMMTKGKKVFQKRERDKLATLMAKPKIFFIGIMKLYFISGVGEVITIIK